MIHRYEGLVADLEVELRDLQRHFDPDKTKITPSTTNQEVVEATA